MRYYTVFWQYLSLVVDIPLLHFCLKCPTLNCCSRLVSYIVECYFSSKIELISNICTQLRLMTISSRSNYLTLVCLMFDVCNSCACFGVCWGLCNFVMLPWLLVLSLTAQLTVTNRSFVKCFGGVAVRSEVNQYFAISSRKHLCLAGPIILWARLR